VPGPPARIQLSPAKVDVGADGNAPVPFTVTLLDSFGKPSPQEQVLTVVLARGKVVGDDLDPRLPATRSRRSTGRLPLPCARGGDRPRDDEGPGGHRPCRRGGNLFRPEAEAVGGGGIADVKAGVNKVSGDTGNASDDGTFEDGFSHDERIALFAKGSVGTGTS